ncbi:MAG: leucine-rich repeat protein [Clostridia bacterium]|nr:leucine-rich repeat protein [Clostridia bacterium]
MLDYSIFENIPDTDGSLFKTKPIADGVMITDYVGKDDMVKIPETIDGKTVYASMTISTGDLWSTRKIFFPSTVQLIVGKIRRKDWLDCVCISPDNQYIINHEGILMNADKSIAMMLCDDSITDVVLPEETKMIYPYAFYQAREIRSIYIGRNVEMIHDGALPDTAAGQMRFHGKPMGYEEVKLEKIEVAEENENFASKDGFLYTKDMKTLLYAPSVIPDGVYEVPEQTVNIAPKAFRGNQGIKKIIAHHELEEIGVKAFEDSFSLEEIELDSVKKIGEAAFYECLALKNASLKNVGTIERNAFAKCEKMERFHAESIGAIGSWAFGNCIMLKDMHLAEGLESIGTYAFGHADLKHIRVPKSVREIGDQAFEKCENLSLEIYDTVKADVGKLVYIYDFLDKRWECARSWISVISAETDEVLYKVYMGKSNGTHSKYREAVVNGWKNYPSFDFASIDEAYSSLKDADEKMEVATLRLRYPVDLSDDMRKTYEDYLKRSMKKILAVCVENNDIESVSFYGQLGFIKREAIDEAIEKCNDTHMKALLLELQSKAQGKPKKQSTRLSLSSSAKPKAEWKAHKDNANQVTRYLGSDTEVVFPAEINGTAITEIANATAKLPENYLNITSVVIPEGYVRLGDNAFNGCENLEKVTLPSTLKEIGKNCFKDCKKLKEIYIPAAVKHIGEKAFYGAGIYSFEFFADVNINDYALGNARRLVAHGESTGCFTNNHYIANRLHYVYSDGAVGGSGLPSATIMPLSYIDIGMETLLDVCDREALKGKKVYCLGKLKALPKGHDFFPRVQFQEFIEGVGGVYAARFGKDTDILVTMQIDEEDSTIMKARAQGTMVLTEREFLMMLKEKTPFNA